MDPGQTTMERREVRASPGIGDANIRMARLRRSIPLLPEGADLNPRPGENTTSLTTGALPKNRNGRDKARP